MTSLTQKVKIEHPRKSNFLYYMCLMDWAGAILSPEEHTKIAQAIIPNGEARDGWLVMSDKSDDLKEAGVMPEYLCGYYHSRLIFQFRLAKSPKTIAEVRTIRQRVEEFAEDYLKSKVFFRVAKVSPLGRKARAFMYPIFELKSDCELWKFANTLPYTLPTTCFYTELPDTGWRLWLLRKIPLFGRFLPGEVRMRISGAKIISSRMSDRFFWNLVNVVYHEGLYRQSREIRIEPREVCKGLEGRLEKFADELITSFSQSLANVVQTTLNALLVTLTVLLLALTIVLILIA